MAAGHRPAARPALAALSLGGVSRFPGGVLPAYRVTRSRAGLAARNPAQRLAARFTAAGVTVTAGHVRVRMGLRGYGYGDRLTSVRAVPPGGSRNRAEYRLGPLTAWYANGPGGPEQGFTSAREPGRVLTLALAFSGDARMALAGGGVEFRRAGSALAYRDRQS